jgi:hypothetical protein
VVRVDAEVDFVEIDFDVNLEVDEEVDFVVADFDEVEADFGVETGIDDDVTVASCASSLLLLSFFLGFLVLRGFV